MPTIPCDSGDGSGIASVRGPQIRGPSRCAWRARLTTGSRPAWSRDVARRTSDLPSAPGMRGATGVPAAMALRVGRRAAAGMCAPAATCLPAIAGVCRWTGVPVGTRVPAATGVCGRAALPAAPVTRTAPSLPVAPGIRSPDNPGMPTTPIAPALSIVPCAPRSRAVTRGRAPRAPVASLRSPAAALVDRGFAGAIVAEVASDPPLGPAALRSDALRCASPAPAPGFVRRVTSGLRFALAPGFVLAPGFGLVPICRLAVVFVFAIGLSPAVGGWGGSETDRGAERRTMPIRGSPRGAPAGLPPTLGVAGRPGLRARATREMGPGRSG